ncbi:hypothetical protein U1Q18_040187 [Sarracenia purpurea var. burkii]
MVSITNFINYNPVYEMYSYLVSNGYKIAQFTDQKKLTMEEWHNEFMVVVEKAINDREYGATPIAIPLNSNSTQQYGKVRFTIHERTKGVSRTTDGFHYE